MNSTLLTSIALGISITIILTILYFLLRIKGKKQIRTAFIFTLFAELICCIGLFFQVILADKLHIPPIYFDYFVYIGTCLLPVFFLFTGIIFIRTKISSKRFILLFLIVPCLSLILLWTNDFHHLFYEYYSINIKETVFGPYFNVHTIYSYTCLGIGLILLISYSIKNSGFFSKQSILFVLGTLIPSIINVLGTFGIINMSIYITPISFSVALLFFALAIFKFKFLSVTPIALQRIVDRISDSYLVLNEDYIITDFNHTFLTTFHVKDSELRNKNLFHIIDMLNEDSIEKNKLEHSLHIVKSSSKTIHHEIHLNSVNKYFNVEINDIKSKNTFLGILILLKDITQHVEDMTTIKDKQDLLMEKERLASLGQLIGGIAHNLKTPIMSIAGASEGLHDLTKEYNDSIGDPEVTSDDHHAIAKEMNEWIEKIKTHTSYMSDVITAVKGQAVVLSEEDEDTFTIEELIKRVDILMKHELKNALINLNTILNVSPSLILTGNVNSLVQVINNMISNSIQSYEGTPNQTIELTVSKDSDKLTICVEDHGCGMKEKVKEKLFKEMITTKGKNGTGLGLFMSYSTVRAHFNGTITFDSEEGKGTIFTIILPI